MAQVKVMRDDKLLEAACQQFLGKKQRDIQNTILQTMEGHLRAILGTLTVEAIYRVSFYLFHQLYTSTALFMCGTLYLAKCFKKSRLGSTYSAFCKLSWSKNIFDAFLLIICELSILKFIWYV